MRALPSSILLASTMTLASFAGSSRANADEKSRCVEAADRAQQDRMDGRLRAAREQLLLCASNECPTAVSRDCDQWLTEVLASLSSVVLSVRDADGRDRMDVRVRMDGAPLVDHLDGKAVWVDPGPHSFEYEIAGRPPVQQSVVILQGEKNRILAFTLSGQGAVLTGPAAPPSPRSASASPLAYVFGAAGALSLAGFAYFVVRAQNAFNRCSDGHACAQSDVDSIATERAAAWALLGVGVLSSGAAVWLFANPRVDVHPVTGGAVARLAVMF